MIERESPKTTLKPPLGSARLLIREKPGAQSKLLDRPTQPIADARIACFEHDG
jgi:hypothetical protein